MYKAYISGALTAIDNPSEIKFFYESIGHLCKKVGLSPYVPHIISDPVNNPALHPRQVFHMDKKQVQQADILIAYLGIASFGVGMELAYAEAKSIPIIILYEQGKTISRFARGIPTLISEICFQTYENAIHSLEPELRNFLLRERI